ncbi:MAG: sarcosine oxidase subunit gamma [Gammaproteobacteria bacterium]|nr:sarcosine oxidase subunit gamma [Gammaproteobacteria bacterium]
MANRLSALAGHYSPGRFGAEGQAGVHLSVVADLRLHQVAAWPDSLPAVGQLLANSIGQAAKPGPGCAISSEQGAVLRIEPLKFWLLNLDPPTIEAEQGCSLDLSHSRTCVHIDGPQAQEFLGRLLPLDLRAAAFPDNRVASSALHHVGVTLWHRGGGYDLFIPRGFAVSIWEVLHATALQFGLEIS